jgi:hypothetical protein
VARDVHGRQPAPGAAGSLIIVGVQPRGRRWLALLSPAVSLLTDLDAFFTEHRRCGDLDAGVGDVMVWIVCDCGALMASGRGRP